MDFLGNTILHSTESVETAVFLSLGSGIFHLGSGSTGSGGEDESEERVIAHGFDQGNGLFEFLLSLTGEAHDHIGSQHQIGHDRLGIHDLLEICFPIVMAVHSLQHPGRAGLEGKMQLLGNLGGSGHGVEELFGRISRVTGHKADLEITGDLGDQFQQISEVNTTIQILAIGVNILTQEGNITNSTFDQFSALGQNILRLAAPFTASDIGHNAVGAEIIAAIHDGNPCFQGVVADLGDTFGDRACFIFYEIGALADKQHSMQNLGELPQVMGGEHTIHMREALLDPIYHMSLACHTAAQENLLAGVTALGVGQCT